VDDYEDPGELFLAHTLSDADERRPGVDPCPQGHQIIGSDRKDDPSAITVESCGSTITLDIADLWPKASLDTQGTLGGGILERENGLLSHGPKNSVS